MDVECELSDETIYVQILQCPNDYVTQNFVDDVNTYVNSALNDPEGVVGVTFYKAHVHINDTKQQYVINLYPFTRRHLTKRIERGLIDTYFQPLRKRGMTVSSEQVLERTGEMKRAIRYHQEPGEDEDGSSCGNVRGCTVCDKITNYWLIVPRAQWDFFNIRYHLYTFEIFHQNPYTKMIHFLTMPCNAVCFMSFLAQFPLFGTRVGYGAWELNAAFILFSVLASLYIIMGCLRKVYAWGFASAGFLAVCWLAGNLWYTIYKTDGHPWFNPMTLGTNPLIWSYIIALIETYSHVIVPQIPPNILGFSHWYSPQEILRNLTKYKTTAARCRSLCFVILATICLPTLSTAVSWISWPHLLGIEVMYIMKVSGYQKRLLKKFFRVAEKAVRSGNPYLDGFPTTAENMSHSERDFEARFKDPVASFDEKLEIRDKENNFKLVMG